MNNGYEYRFGPGNEWRILVANTRELREAAFRLVYDIYRKDGYDLRYGRESGLWCTIHHLHPGTVIFLAERGGRPVGSVTVVPDSPLGLPTDRIFPEPLAGLRSAGRRLCEISSLVAAEEPDGLLPTVAMHFYRLTHLTGVHLMNSSDVVASIMSHHSRFYSRLLLFDDVSPQPRQSPKTGQMVAYARLNFETMPARYEARYGRTSGSRNLHRWFFDNSEQPATLEWLARNRKPMTLDELYYFGARRTNVLSKVGDAAVAALEDCYRDGSP